MREWIRRTWRRLREESPARALRASGHEAAAGTVGRAASRAYARRTEPTTIWERDWDVLCLLDGCRVDQFRTVADRGDYGFLPAGEDVETIWSVGSQSAEWMAVTFGPDHAAEMARTAYVSGNPFTAQPGDQLVSVETESLPLDRTDFGVLYEAWRDEWIDDDISTIPPAPLTDAAIAAWRNREELGVDRVVVHYMQPHTPFRSRPDWFLGSAPIDDWGQLDDEDGEPAGVDGDDTAGEAGSDDGRGAAGGEHTGGAGNGDAGEADSGDAGDAAEEIDFEDLDQETQELLVALNADSEADRDPWTRLRDGELPADEFWAAYRDNLRWVLDDVARLVENCDGRVAMTSDHGNAAGEFGVWSHPPAVHLPALREVPWVTVDGEDRGTHEPALPDGVLAAAASDRSASDRETEPEEAVAGATAEQRLADLGYR